MAAMLLKFSHSGEYLPQARHCREPRYDSTVVLGVSWQAPRVDLAPALSPRAPSTEARSPEGRPQKSCSLHGKGAREQGGSTAGTEAAEAHTVTHGAFRMAILIHLSYSETLSGDQKYHLENEGHNLLPLGKIPDLPSLAEMLTGTPFFEKGVDGIQKNPSLRNNFALPKTLVMG